MISCIMYYTVFLFIMHCICIMYVCTLAQPIPTKLSVTASIDLAQPSRIRSLPQIKSTPQRYHTSTMCRERRRGTGVFHRGRSVGYADPRLKEGSRLPAKGCWGKLLNPTVVGDDASISFGRCLAVALQDARPDIGMELEAWRLCWAHASVL